MNAIKDTVGQLCGQNEFEAAIKMANQYPDAIGLSKRDLSDLGLLLGRISELNRNKALGLLSPSDIELQTNKLRVAVCKLLKLADIPQKRTETPTVSFEQVKEVLKGLKGPDNKIPYAVAILELMELYEAKPKQLCNYKTKGLEYYCVAYSIEEAVLCFLDRKIGVTKANLEQVESIGENPTLVLYA